MNITQNNVTFAGGMKFRQIASLLCVHPAAVEKQLKKYNVDANFDNSKIASGVTYWTADIFYRLKKKLPPQVDVFEFFREKDAHAFCNIYDFLLKDNGKLSRQFGIDFNKKHFFADAPIFYDAFCDCRKEGHGTDHFLGIAIHEFVHSDFLQNLLQLCVQNKKDFHKVVKNLKQIDISPFREELTSKIGLYSATNPLEMHAEYWTNEICQSLDHNLHPRYNPFETPQIELSKGLKDFISKVTAYNFIGAKRIATKAKN